GDREQVTDVVRRQEGYADDGQDEYGPGPAPVQSPGGRQRGHDERRGQGQKARAREGDHDADHLEGDDAEQAHAPGGGRRDQEEGDRQRQDEVQQEGQVVRILRERRFVADDALHRLVHAAAHVDAAGEVLRAGQRDRYRHERERPRDLPEAVDRAHHVGDQEEDRQSFQIQVGQHADGSTRPVREGNRHDRPREQGGGELDLARDPRDRQAAAEPVDQQRGEA